MTDSKQPRQYDAQIMLCAGGTPAIVASEYEIIPRGIRIMADVPGELAKLNIRNRADAPCFVLPLGGDISMGELIQTASPEMAQALQQKPPFNLGLGGGQNRGVGQVLSVGTVNQAEFDEFYLRRLLPEINLMSGGLYSAFRLICLAGKCGAMGSGAIQHLAQSLARRLARDTGARIDLQLVTTGAIGWLGNGVNLLKNCGAAQAEHVLFTREAAHSENVNVTHLCFELLPSRNDQALRNRMLAEILQAVFSPGFDQPFLAGIPNEGRNSAWGTNVIITVDRARSLEESEVVADVAHEYGQALARLLDAPADAQLFGKAEVRLTSRPLHRDPIDTLMDRFDALDAEELVELVEAPAAEQVGEVYLPRTQGQPLHVNRLRLFSGGSKVSMHTLRAALVMLRSIAANLSNAVQDAELQIEELHDACEKQARAVRWRHRVIKRNPLLTRMFGLPSWLAALGQQCDILREESDLLREAEAKLAALQNALVETEDEERELTERLTQVLQGLERASSQAHRSHRKPLIHAAPIDDSLQELLECQGFLSALQPALRRSVQCVTLEGLQQILGAASSRPEELVRTLNRGTCFTNGPPWGGKPVLNRGNTVIVLPPLTPADQAALLAAREAIKGSAELLSADAATYSVNVLRIHYKSARDVSELFPALIQRGLEAALDDPERDMFITDSEAVKRLGVFSKQQAAEHVNGRSQ